MITYDGYVISEGYGHGPLVTNSHCSADSAIRFEPYSIVALPKLSILSALELVRGEVSGVVLSQGGLTSHACVLLKSAHVPCLVIPDLFDSSLSELDGKRAVIDSVRACLIISDGNKQGKIEYE